MLSVSATVYNHALWITSYIAVASSPTITTLHASSSHTLLLAVYRIYYMKLTDDYKLRNMQNTKGVPDLLMHHRLFTLPRLIRTNIELGEMRPWPTSLRVV